MELHEAGLNGPSPQRRDAIDGAGSLRLRSHAAGSDCFSQRSLRETIDAMVGPGLRTVTATLPQRYGGLP